MKWTKKIAYSRKVAPYIFILPFVLSFLIFNLYIRRSNSAESVSDTSSAMGIAHQTMWSPKSDANA